MSYWYKVGSQFFHKYNTYLIVIQARVNSTRLPGKALMNVGGIPIVKRLWNAAKEAQQSVGNDRVKVVVAWPERYPEISENNVLGRFILLSDEFPTTHIIRLTADCPLIEAKHIIEMIHIGDRMDHWNGRATTYYMDNRAKYPDGYDIQLFEKRILVDPTMNHREHVIDPKYVTKNTIPGHLSVDTLEDLQRLRTLCKIR